VRVACGYVIKSDAADELLMALEAVIQGKRFVKRQIGVPRFH
jgi:hypothetical protein